MRVYRLESRHTVPVDADAAWTFFSNPANLAALTPDDIDFRITCKPPEAIYPGLFLHYRIAPVLKIPVDWITEITSVDAPRRFVDEQRTGPYKLWHHEHEFHSADGGTEIHDLVHYALPLDPLSRLLHEFVVRGQLTDLFRFRNAALEERFGPAPATAPTSEIGIRPV